MKIGISGAHRTGKTTLAQKIVEKLPYITFKPTHITSAAIWENHGIEPDGQFTFIERLAIQKQLFEHMKMDQNITIYDRTYIDLLGYLYSNVDSTCSTIYDDEVTKFTIDVMQAMYQDFQKVIIVPPAIPIQSTQQKMGKVYMSRAYIESINNHIVSYAVRSHVPYKIIPWEMVDNIERTAWSVHFIETPTA